TWLRAGPCGWRGNRSRWSSGWLRSVGSTLARRRVLVEVWLPAAHAFHIAAAGFVFQAFGLGGAGGFGFLARLGDVGCFADEGDELFEGVGAVAFLGAMALSFD